MKNMKKWRICCLFAWCAALLLGFAAAEDGHNWQWGYNANGHTRYCDGCATHSNRLIDESSSGAHSYRCVWPETETDAQKGYVYLDIECSVCGRSEQVQALIKGGSDPTCTRAGIRIYQYIGNYKVPEADKTKRYTLPAIPHLFTNYTRNDDATCTQNETETAMCAYLCETVDVREIPNTALGHDPKQHPAKAATCTEPGWNAYETCKRKGCDYTTRVEIPALDHKFVVVDSQAPTCANAGYTIIACQREGCTVSRRNEIPKLLHDLEHHDAKAPTCTESGWEAYDTCKNCDYTTYQEIPALAHWYSEWAPAANATHAATCLRSCGHSKAVACEMHPLNATLTFCPVCGEISDGTRLTRVNATAKSAQKMKGELTVRTGTLDSGDTVLTIAFEIGGKLVKTNREIRVTLPASVLNGGTLCLLNADGTEIPLNATKQGENIVLTLNFKDAPVAVLHVHPAA